MKLTKLGDVLWLEDTSILLLCLVDLSYKKLQKFWRTISPRWIHGSKKSPSKWAGPPLYTSRGYHIPSLSSFVGTSIFSPTRRRLVWFKWGQPRWMTHFTSFIGSRRGIGEHCLLAAYDPMSTDYRPDHSCPAASVYPAAYYALFI